MLLKKELSEGSRSERLKIQPVKRDGSAEEFGVAASNPALRPATPRYLDVQQIPHPSIDLLSFQHITILIK